MVNRAWQRIVAYAALGAVIGGMAVFLVITIAVWLAGLGIVFAMVAIGVLMGIMAGVGAALEERRGGGSG